MIQINTSLPYIGYLDSQIGGRSENQDCCGYVDTSMGLLVVVCDGMGGGPGGRTASMMAVEVIVNYISSVEKGSHRGVVLQTAIQKAHEAILQKQVDIPAFRGMGTTVVALLINKESAWIAHVGDSRLYQFRWGKSIFRTADHSMVGELVRNGTLTEEQARLSSQSNVITRALGHGDECLVDIKELSYESKDRFLLCTDGIWGMMPEKNMIDLVAKTPSLSGIVESMVIKVNEAGINSGGHHDNLTLVILETKQNSKLKQKMSTKVRNFLLALLAVCCLSILGNAILYKRLKAKPENVSVEQLDVDKLVDEKVQDAIEKLESQYEEEKEELLKQIRNLTDENQHLEEKLKLAPNASSQLQNDLDYIIEQLKKLKEQKDTKKKKVQVKKLTEYIENLKNELLDAGIKETDLVGDKGVVTLLKQPRALQEKKKSEGHYNAIIEMVQSFKGRVK